MLNDALPNPQPSAPSLRADSGGGQRGAGRHHHPITGTGTNAETKTASERTLRSKALTGRILDHAQRLGVSVNGRDLRLILRALAEQSPVDAPTDEQIIRSLMRAPWQPKPRVRQWRVGEAGWRTST